MAGKSREVLSSLGNFFLQDIAADGFFSLGMLARLGEDQLADAEPARAAFGYQPRRFEP